MFRSVDAFLDRVTMYRLALYYLLFLLGYASVLGFLGVLPYGGLSILALAFILPLVTKVTNQALAGIFHADENIESPIISGLILALIINPDPTFARASFIFWVLAGSLASVSKYLFAPFKKHIFNPAAFAVAVTASAIGHPAGWWVGSPAMLPPVFFGGLLVARKLRKSELVLSFLATSLVLLYWKGGWAIIPQTFYNAPLFFFTFVMLTEPSTTPTRKPLRLLYGTLVGIFSIFTTYELALLSGNIFSFLVSSKYRMILKLKEKKEIAPGISEFSFTPGRKLKYLPGQYMEWTLKHQGADSRGVRRFFTIASSPTEPEIKLGTKFSDKGSTFKKTLSGLLPGAKISAARVEGDFTLPKDKNKKLAFIAGGIGITPFRSMIKYLLDMEEKRDIVFFYSNRTAAEIVWREIFEQAEKQLGMKIIYINSDTDGFLDEKKISGGAPDFKERIFYISGPHGLVEAFEKILPKMGVPASQIKTDFFPGYA